jgi:hypothetical protein
VTGFWCDRSAAFTPLQREKRKRAGPFTRRWFMETEAARTPRSVTVLREPQ